MSLFKKDEEKSKKPLFDKKHFKSLFTSRAFRVGTYSTFASLAVIAIAVGVILFTDRIPSTYTQFDITKNGLFTLSEQSKQIVGSLNKEVDVYLLVQNGNEDVGIKKMLQRYEALSDKIKVTVKDPVLNPSFAKQYTGETVYDNSIIVVCGKRSKFVSYNDIYVSTTDYSTYQTSTDFNGESSLTSAIDYVTSEKLPKAYILTGNGEKELSSAAAGAISKANIETASLNLLTTDAVPEDANSLIIISPASDITAPEKAKIVTYLQNGGNLLLVSDYTEAEMPNLNALMEYYGVKTVRGIVVEGDQNYCVSKYKHYLLPKINDHTITTPLKDGGYYVLMPIAEGIQVLDDHRDTVTVTQLLTTSNKAYAKADGMKATTMDKSAGDTDGPFALGVAITDTADGKNTKIAWYTSANMLDDQIDEMVNGSNLNLFTNSLNWMCARERNISISSKSLSNTYLTVPAAASSLWSIIIAGIVPLGFFAAGIAVWYKRRRK